MAGVDKVHLLIHLSAYPPPSLCLTSPHHLFLSHHVSPVPPLYLSLSHSASDTLINSPSNPNATV